MNEQSFHAPRRIAQRKFVPLVMIVLLVSLFSFVAVKNDSKSAYAVSDQSIMGGPTVSAAQLVAWFNHTTVKPYNASVPLATLASLYINEGLRYGIRGDIAFIQGIWETAWFSFINSAVSAGQNNFAGINCPSTSCPQSNTFADAQTGVRAQIQLLRNYADATSRTANPTHNPNISVIPDAQILPNFDTFTNKGAAPTWIGLNGKWAVPGSTYGQSLWDCTKTWRHTQACALHVLLTHKIFQPKLQVPDIGSLPVTVECSLMELRSSTVQRDQ